MIELGIALGLVILGGAIILVLSTSEAPRRRASAQSRRTSLEPRGRSAPAVLPPRGDDPPLVPTFEVLPRERASLKAARFAIGLAALAVALAVGILVVVRGIGLIIDRLVRF